MLRPVVGCVPVGVSRAAVREVDEVRRGQARLDQRHVVVGEPLADRGREVLVVTQAVCGSPDLLHDHVGVLGGDGLDRKRRVGVAHHVQEEAVHGPTAVRERGRVAPGPQEHVGDGRPVVLPVHEEDVDPERRAMRGQQLGEMQEHGRSRCPVVRAGHGRRAQRRIGSLVGRGARVPVREQQDPPRLLGREARQDVHEGERVPSRRHVLEGVGREHRRHGEALEHPLELPGVTLRPRHSRAERDLGLHERVRRLAVEGRAAGRRPARLARVGAGAEQQQRRDETLSCGHGGR